MKRYLADVLHDTLECSPVVRNWQGIACSVSSQSAML